MNALSGALDTRLSRESTKPAAARCSVRYLHQRCFSIAAASILAKVARDTALEAWDTVFPEYCLKDNKGYGTPEHLAALDRLGPTALHRFSFEPVRNQSYSSRYEPWTGYPIPQP